MSILKKIFKKIAINKIHSCISGYNNKFICLYHNKEFPIKKKSKNSFFQIIGNNNTVIFETDKMVTKLPKGISICIKGDNNYIKIKQPKFADSTIYMSGDYNKFELGKTVKQVEGGHFFVEMGGEVYIDDDCELGNSSLWVVVNGDIRGIHHKLVIGKGTHIAKDAIIRTSDGECIIDKKGKPLSEPQDVIIGPNCWITSRCTILKGTILPEGSIVAANSLVNKKFLEKNCLIAGCPATIKKQNIHWIPYPYGVAMEKYQNTSKSKKAFR